MARFELLQQADVAALLTLVGEVTELPADKTVRRTHVLDKLLRMIGGRSAVVFELADPDEGPFARAGTVINLSTTCLAEAKAAEAYLIHNNPPDPTADAIISQRGKTITDVCRMERQEWQRLPHYDVVRRPFDIDHSLYCQLMLPSGQGMVVGLQRSPGDPEFSERERAMVHFLHTHAPHVYDAPAPKPTEVESLAPRLQPVFRCLLQGASEKEVAAKLKLSRHTVHRYTQTIYRELGVNTRAELLAKYARWS